MNNQDKDAFEKWWRENKIPENIFDYVVKAWQAALEDERNKEQEKIKSLIKALEFYADENNWQSIQVGYGSRSQIKHYDLFDTSTDDTQRLVGGFKAREILKEYKDE